MQRGVVDFVITLTTNLTFSWLDIFACHYPVDAPARVDFEPHQQLESWNTLPHFVLGYLRLTDA